MQIDVVLNGARTPIARSAFVALLENSVASDRVPFTRALERAEISFADLKSLARVGDIPYSLFFAPLPLVDAQIKAKSKKLLQGLTKQTFSLNSRETVELCDIELIVKDLLRKQELLKKNDDTLGNNRIVGLLRRPDTSAEGDAEELLGALELTQAALRSARNKSAALELIIARLEANQVLVSQSVNNFMPQRLQGVKFSGITVKDRKVPYIFLAGGEHGDFQEPLGRRVFTLTLMSVLVARGIFAPVTYDGRSAGSDVRREYDVVGEMLMPEAEMKRTDIGSLGAMKEAADLFKVTPTAMVVRSLRLGMVGRDLAHTHMEELAHEYTNREQPPMRQPKPVNAIRKYNGREFSRRMLDALDSGKLSGRAFCREVCLNNLKPSQIDEFREALR